MTLGEDSEEKGDYVVRDPPWGVSGSSHRLGSQHREDTGILHREDEPPWLVGGTLRLTGGLWEAWTLLRRSLCPLAPEAGQRGQIEDALGDAGFPVTTMAHAPA